MNCKQNFEKVLDPRLDEAEQGKRGVYFLDASHFVYGGVLGVLRTAIRLIISTGSGRQRLNVLGAIAYHTLQFRTVINTGAMTKNQVCELLKLIHAAHRKPVSVVLDNARYQSNNTVKNLAASLNIEPVFLPAYSLNLNLIERVCKFLEKEALAARGLSQFSLFRQSIESTLAGITTTHRSKMKALIARSFQLFGNAQILR